MASYLSPSRALGRLDHAASAVLGADGASDDFTRALPVVEKAAVVVDAVTSMVKGSQSLDAAIAADRRAAAAEAAAAFAEAVAKAAAGDDPKAGAADRKAAEAARAIATAARTAMLAISMASADLQSRRVAAANDYASDLAAASVRAADASAASPADNALKAEAQRAEVAASAARAIAAVLSTGAVARPAPDRPTPAGRQPRQGEATPGLGDFLSKKLGPLPVYGWGLVAGGAVTVLGLAAHFAKGRRHARRLAVVLALASSLFAGSASAQQSKPLIVQSAGVQVCGAATVNFAGGGVTCVNGTATVPDGAGGVTSIAAGLGITATPDPIVATGTIAIDQSASLVWSGLEVFSRSLTGQTTGSPVSLAGFPSVSGNAGGGGTNSATPIIFNLSPTLDLTGTINNSGYTGILLNVTESNIGSGTKKLLDLEVGGVSQMYVANTGAIFAPSVTSTTTTLNLSAGSAGVLINARSGTNYIDVGNTVNGAVAIAAGIDLGALPGTGGLVFDGMTGDARFPTGEHTWAGAPGKVGSLVAGGSMRVDGGAELNLGNSGATSIAIGHNNIVSQFTGLMVPGVYATAALPATCTNGALVWDSTTNTLKRCLTNAFANVARAEFNFDSWLRPVTHTAPATIAQTTVTNAATIASATAVVQTAGGAGAGNAVINLCDDGATCAGGHIYVTCTQACTVAINTVTTCTVNAASVAAGTTLTMSVQTACASSDPGSMINVHFLTAS